MAFALGCPVLRDIDDAGPARTTAATPSSEPAVQPPWHRH